jgi:hypothetical protein
MQTVPHSQAILQAPGSLSLRLSLTGQRRLNNFMCSMPTDLMLCQDITLLIQLNIGLTKGRTATELGSFSS